MSSDHFDDDSAAPALEPTEPEPTRKPRVRGRTISIKRLSKRALEQGRIENPPSEHTRPTTRGECLQGEGAQRPCPWVTCRWNLALDVNPRSGAVKINYPTPEGDVDWSAMRESCALDVADRGPATLEDVGEIVGLVRERIRQVEAKALASLKRLAAVAAWVDAP